MFYISISIDYVLLHTPMLYLIVIFICINNYDCKLTYVLASNWFVRCVLLYRVHTMRKQKKNKKPNFVPVLIVIMYNIL